MQFSTYIPFRISGVLIAEEISVEVFVELDCNNEPYVETLWIENLGDNAPLKLCSKEKDHTKKSLWNDLSPLAWDAVRGDVADEMPEAA